MESEDSDIGDMLDDLLANAEPTESEEPPPKKTLKELDYNFLDTPTSGKATVSNRLKDDGGPSLVHEADVDSSDDEDKRNFEEQKYSDCGRDLKNLLKRDAASSSERASRAEKGTESGSFDFNGVKSGSFNFNGVKSGSFNFDGVKSGSFDFNGTKSGSFDSNAPKNGSPSANGLKKPGAASSSAAKAKEGHTDPIFGIKLVKPLISSSELVERMRGRTPVTVSKVKTHIMMENTRNDWVIAGVVINRSATKVSQKGSQYCIWKLSDLSEKLSTVSLFIFSGAYKLFWNTTVGTVVGILNPNIMDSKDDVDLATLSVDNAQKIMVLGSSRDMAKCKSTKKNGEPCSNIVNLSRCEYCVYHVKQEYNKASKRADIQSNANGRGFSSSLQPKNKAPRAGIYAQGAQPFTPIFAKRNEKLYEKDSARLALLKGAAPVAKPASSSPKAEKPERKACSVELTPNQTKKDLERLNKLRGWSVAKQTTFVLPSESSGRVEKTASEQRPSLSKSSPFASKSSPSASKSSPSVSKSSPSASKSSSSVSKSSLSASKSSQPLSNSSPSLLNSSPAITNPLANLAVPRLGVGVKGGSIDFSQPITKKHVNAIRMNAARLNAARWVKENCGALKQSNPNKVRESREKMQEAGAKRRREVEETDAENERLAKKPSTGVSDKFREMMEAKSAHVDLVEKSQDEEQEKYFRKLEVKERMEEKMLTTFKVDCKAVKCILCKYTSFSASDLCKEQKHPLRVIDATKSFFKCADCGNRTVSLDRIPSHSCNKCGGSHWTRAAMMDEKRTDIPGAKLSIRGGEETFIGSVTQDANLDLLVPDTGTS